jgi:hypothetical protein
MGGGYRRAACVSLQSRENDLAAIEGSGSCCCQGMPETDSCVRGRDLQKLVANHRKEGVAVY